MIKYSTKLGDEICDTIARSSISLHLICKQLKLSYATVTKWIFDPQHEMYQKYLQAKQMQLHVLAEEVCTMVDELANDEAGVAQNGKNKTTAHRDHISRTRLRMQARIAIITKIAPALYGTRPQKTKHKVIMPEPPKPSAPAPKSVHNNAQSLPEEQLINQSTDQQINQSSSPKTTRKYLPDGTYEDYNEHGNLIRKSMKPYNPKPHHQGFW